MNESDIEKIIQSQSVENTFALEAAILLALDKLCKDEIIHKLGNANFWIINKRFQELNTEVQLSYRTLLELKDICNMLHLNENIDPTSANSQTVSIAINNIHDNIKFIKDSQSKN